MPIWALVISVWRSGADGVTSTSTSSGTRSGSVAAIRSAVSPPSDMPTTSRGFGAHSAQQGPQCLGVELWSVVAVLAPSRPAVAGQVDRQRGRTDAQDHRVPGVCVLPTAVQEDHAR